MEGSEYYQTKLIEKKDLENGRRKKRKRRDSDPTVSIFVFLLYWRDAVQCDSAAKSANHMPSIPAALSYFPLTVEAPFKPFPSPVAMNLDLLQLS